MDEGPLQAGFRGACGRSTMVQQLSDDRCGVCYTVVYSAPLCKNLGVSSQQSAFVSDHLHAAPGVGSHPLAADPHRSQRASSLAPVGG